MAFIFDMNGTMIDDMHYHNTAWFKVFKELGSTLTEEETKLNIFGKAAEIFDRILGKEHGFSFDQINEISLKKEKQYQIDFLPDLKLINGLDAFFEKAKHKNIPMSIGTAAPQSNIDYVFKNLDVAKYFTGTVSADEVENSKPNPEVFLKCAALMNATPETCIVFEDSPMGIMAADNAGMQSVAITTFHPKEDFDKFNNILFVIEDFTDERLNTLFQ